MKNPFGSIIFFIVICFLITGCIPTIPGGNPTPATVNQFNINISDQGLDYNSTNSDMWKRSKTLFIDGDSINFRLDVIWNWAPIEYFSISFKSTAGVYEFLTKKDTSLSTPRFIFTPLSANINVPNSLDADFIWTLKQAYGGGPIDYNFRFGYQLSGGSITLGNTLLPITPNVDQYFVFRKLKGISYQYYWVKVKYIPSVLPVFLGGQNGSGYDFNILYGNYQMDNITTGQ